MIYYNNIEDIARYKIQIGYMGHVVRLFTLSMVSL